MMPPRIAPGRAHRYTPSKPLCDHAVNPIRAVKTFTFHEDPRRHAARVVCIRSTAR
jgi:hypothetical protein